MKHKCTACGHEDEINPASLLGKGKKKTMTPEAIEQRSKAAKSRWSKEPITPAEAGKEEL